MGGGLLETNNQLERFTKNKKSKKLTYSIIGILLIIGSITLFKTYAFFEEKREFNVLKGRIPEFSQEDIQISFTIDGEKGNQFPDKTSRYVGKTVTCEKEVEASWNNETWGLEIINSHQQKRINCSVEFKTISEFSEAKLGDYVSYTPSKTNYEITSDLTGYNTVQSINPSELNLWRIIRKNSDGSIEMVSEYTSSNQVSFYGKEGYKNLIGSLNTIAKQYETSNITGGSRYLGYSGQTEYITDNTLLDLTKPLWEETTNDNTYEKQGGGDMLYQSDVSLVKQACGTLQAYKVDAPNEANGYWLARRFFENVDDSYMYRGGRINSFGSILVSYHFFRYYEDQYYPVSAQLALRPIIILKTGIQASSGDGTKGNPWKVN
jgi:hypothetical protein